jgi:hypothetical protein
MLRPLPKRRPVLFDLILLTTLSMIAFQSTVVASQPELGTEFQAKADSWVAERLNEKAIPLKFKEVSRVVFFQSGRASRFGFFRNVEGFFSRGLWVRVESNQKENWGFRVQLNEPMNIKQHSALAFWLRSNHADLEFWLAIEDKTIGVTAMTKPIKIAKKGLRSFQPVLVPLSDFDSAVPLETPTINEFIVYFNQIPSKIMVEAMGFLSGTPKPVLIPPPTRDQTRSKSKALTPKRAVAALSVTLAPLPSPTPSIQFSAVEIKQEYLSDPRHPATPPKSSTTDETHKNMLMIRNYIFAGVLKTILLAIIVFSIFFLARALWRKRPQKNSKKIPKFIYRTERILDSDEWGHWPHAHIQDAWISPNLVGYKPKKPEDLFFGETLISQQVKDANTFQINLIPSINFSKIPFRPEYFYSKPHLFLSKALTPVEFHLSDHELTTKHNGYLPVWIPPYWQKKNNLSQRMLVSYGRCAGGITISNSLQYHLRSPHLMEYAEQILMKFPPFCKGVRIECAADLLSVNLNSLDHQFNGAPKIEFWRRVLPPIKAKAPHFLILADAAGPHMKKLFDLGFDMAENDLLVKALLETLLHGHSYEVQKWLLPECRPLLRRSVYNLSNVLNNYAHMGLRREQVFVAAKVLALLPGMVEHNDNIPPELRDFFLFVSGNSLLLEGEFAALPTNSSDVLGFARWVSKNLIVALANLSKEQRDVSVYIDPIAEAFSADKMYLVDVLYSESHDSHDVPAMAILGRDVLDAGFSTTMPELSVKLFSVSLTKPISYEFTAKLRQFRQT